MIVDGQFAIFTATNLPTSTGTNSERCDCSGSNHDNFWRWKWLRRKARQIPNPSAIYGW